MRKYYSVFMMLLAAAIWGFAFSAQKLASSLGVFTIGAVRNLFATLFLIPVITVLDAARGDERKLFSRKNKNFIDLNRFELIGGVLCGIILTVASAFQQYGISDGTDAGKASFITALYVLIVPIFGLFYGKRSPLNVWISVGIAVVGFYLLCIKGDLTMVASDAMVLACAVIFALHIIVIDRCSPRCDGVRMSVIQFASAMVLNIICTLIFEAPIPIAEIGADILPLLYLGIGSSGIAYTLQIVAQKNVHPAAGAVVLSLESVFGVIGSSIILHEVMSVREYIGCAVVFCAVVLAQVDIVPLIKSKIIKKTKFRKVRFTKMNNYKKIKIEDINRSAVDMIANGWLLIVSPDKEKHSGANAMTASWGALGELWGKPAATIYIRPQRHSMPLVESAERISLCFPTEEYRDAMKVCGVKSGRDTDKLKELSLECAEYDGVKYIDGSELVMICKKLYADNIKEECFTDEEPLSCYKQKDYHRFYILEIETVLCKSN